MIKYSLAFLLSSLMWFSCAGDGVTENQTSEQKVKTIQKDISAEEFKEKASSGFILDVRTPEEFSEGYISGAQNLNFYDAGFSAALDKLDKNVPVYVYCRSGARSSQASDMMKKKGFKEVYNLEGGYSHYPYK